MEGTWRRRAVGLLGAMLLAGCGGNSSSPAVVSMTPITVPSSLPVVTDVPAVDTTTTAETTTTTTVLSLSSLPGRLAITSVDCASSLGLPSDLTIQICFIDPDGTDLVLGSDPSLDVFGGGWSNDGTIFYFADERGLFYVNADGSGQRPRAEGESPVPGESPDGKWTVYSPYGDPGFSIEPIGGGPPIAVVTSPDSCCSTARWSPDSRSLVYTAFPPGTQDCAQLWRADIDTRKSTPLTGPGSPSEDQTVCVELDSGRWSPDGSAILFMDEHRVTGNWRPYLVAPDGSDLRPLVEEGAFGDPQWVPTGMAWSPDGRAVALAALVGMMGDGLYIIAADGSGMVEVDLPPLSIAGLSEIAWAPGL